MMGLFVRHIREVGTNDRMRMTSTQSFHLLQFYCKISEDKCYTLFVFVTTVLLEDVGKQHRISDL